MQYMMPTLVSVSVFLRGLEIHVQNAQHNVSMETSKISVEVASAIPFRVGPGRVNYVMSVSTSHVRMVEPWIARHAPANAAWASVDLNVPHARYHKLIASMALSFDQTPVIVTVRM